MVTRESWFSVWIDRFLSCLRGTKPAPGILGKNPSGGLDKEQTANMPNLSDDFWSTSTCDPDERNIVQSRQIISSISTTNHIPNYGNGTDHLSNHSDFVNHGFVHWNQSRLQWIGNGESAKKTKKSRHPGLSWYMSKELLLETRKPFHRQIPLSEMVDFLVEEWEEEGLYY